MNGLSLAFGTQLEAITIFHLIYLKNRLNKLDRDLNKAQVTINYVFIVICGSKAEDRQNMSEFQSIWKLMNCWLNLKRHSNTIHYILHLILFLPRPDHKILELKSFCYLFILKWPIVNIVEVYIVRCLVCVYEHLRYSKLCPHVACMQPKWFRLVHTSIHANHSL